MAATRSGREYYLSRRAHVCIQDGALLFMDERRGQYHALTAGETTSIQPFLRGLPALTEQDEHNDATGIHQLAERRLKTLLEMGLITDDPARGKPAAPLVMNPPTEPLAKFFAERPPSIDVNHVRSFLLSLAYAKFAIRCLRFHGIVGRVAKGKQQAAPFNVHTAARLVSIYNRLRLCTFTARDACFLDSLTLVTFLLRNGLGAQWAFGVQASPFQAHCWIQQDSIILNDTPAKVCLFTPVMVV